MAPRDEDLARWREENLELVAQTAKTIIRRHRLSQRKFFREWRISGASVYLFFIEYVRMTVIGMSPAKLGRIVSTAEGKIVDLLGIDRTDDRPRTKTTVHLVNGKSNTWLGQDWSGESMLRRAAASVLIAEICDQLELDIDELLCFHPRVPDIRTN